jgi:tetratricopeptide (TPR) repeat protein
VKRTRWILALSLATASAVPGPILAQTREQTGEVVQTTPSAAAVASLNRNLAVLSRRPQDETALLGAAQAALDLGDIQAANGFFTRANLVNPNLGKAKLGLAIVQIALKQADEAAANFDAAQALGESAQGHLAERGLAYDLTGQQVKAQRDYEAALRANPADEQARLRYAVSLGISGQVAEANKQIEPALSSGDREAWRLRAFVFAMNGRMADARKVTQAVMPKGLADALDPYMQRLPLLTPAQKAAAAHYGEFPSNVLKLAAPDPAREVQVAAVEERDTNRRDRRNRTNNARNQKNAKAETAAAASLPPALTPPTPPANVQVASNNVTPPVPVARTSSGSRSAGLPPSAPAIQRAQPVIQRVQPAPQPTFEAPATVQLATRDDTPPAPAPNTRSTITQGPADPRSAPATMTPPASTPTPGFSAPARSIAPQAPAPAQSRLSLADALSSLDVPDQERQRAVAADMTAVARIQDQRRKAADTAAKAAAKAKADKEAKAKADAEKKAEAERKAKLAANPARIWVQVATGREVDALAFDLRRLRRTYADALGDTAGWTAQWGATRRLLVGPFKKIDEARATVTQITKSGGDAFVWQSDAGEEVAKIGGK